MLFDFLNKKSKNVENLEVIEANVEESENTNEIAMGCACEPCETSPNCSSIVTFTFQTCMRGPAPAVNTLVPIEFTEENLRCVIEKCSALVQVPDPCNPSSRIPCTVCLNRYRYVGCLDFIANIPRPERPVSACFSGCELIDRIRCYTCSDDCRTCPPAGGFIRPGATARVASVDYTSGDLVVVTVRVTLELTNPCATVAP